MKNLFERFSKREWMIAGGAAVLVLLLVLFGLPILFRGIRNGQRKGALEKVDEAVKAYQADNGQRLPGTIAEGSDAVCKYAADAKAPFTFSSSAETKGSACAFIKTYLNKEGVKENTFTDPSGRPYGIQFAILTTGEDGTADANGVYKFTSEYDEHMIHIVRSAKCGADKKSVVSGTNVRGYAILYEMEGGEKFCREGSDA